MVKISELISGKTITSWRDFLQMVGPPYFIGVFRAVAVIGPQGAGKSTLAINTVLRRVYHYMYTRGLWKPGDGVEPLASEFNPYADVIDMHMSHGAFNRHDLSIVRSNMIRIIAPTQILTFTEMYSKPDIYGLVLDEVPLWSQDVRSWWHGSEKEAREFLRHFVVNVRGVTNFVLVLAQDLKLIPAPIRYPIELVVDVQRFVLEEYNRVNFRGKVIGNIKKRYTSGVRSPRSESSFYKVADFELPVYMSTYVADSDLYSKKFRISAVLKRAKHPTRRQITTATREVFGAKAVTALATGSVTIEAIDDKTVVIRGIKQPCAAGFYLHRLFLHVIESRSCKSNERTVVLKCYDTVIKPCRDVLVELAKIAVGIHVS